MVLEADSRKSEIGKIGKIRKIRNSKEIGFKIRKNRAQKCK